MASAPQTRIGTREFVVLIAMLQALHALAIDSMLPALGTIAQDLHAADTNQRQLIVGIFLLGSGLGSLIPGTLADRFGRKPVLHGCLAAYCLLNLACALVRDFPALIALRCLTGFVTAGMTVLPMAIIRDRFEGDHMARLQSLVAMIFMIVPVVAPSLGQGVLLFAGWRWIFGIMAGMSALLMLWSGLRLAETLAPEYRQPIRLGTIAANMAAIVTTRAAIGYILAMSSTTAMFFIFLSTSQQLIAEHFGAGQAFPLVFAAMASTLALANFTNSRLVMRFGARRVSHAALLVYIGVGVLQVLLAYSPHETLWQFAVVMGLTMCLTGARKPVTCSSSSGDPAATGWPPWAMSCGKGLAAALYMAQATALLEQALQREDQSLENMLGSLDHTLRQLLGQRGFLTLVLLEWDEEGHYRLARAGHPGALLLQGVAEDCPPR